jgi:hypothetical protein
MHGARSVMGVPTAIGLSIWRGGCRRIETGGADRFKTRSWWRRNMISASRPACDLKSPKSHPPRSLKRSIKPAKLPHRYACASPDELFGMHRRQVCKVGLYLIGLAAVGKMLNVFLYVQPNDRVLFMGMAFFVTFALHRSFRAMITQTINQFPGSTVG